MKRNLLSLVQSVLADLGSDQVNNYDDTVESTDIAYLIRDVYYDLISETKLDEHYDLFRLTASGDTDKPTLMTLPTTVLSLDWVKYNNQLSTETAPDWQPVSFLPIKDMIDRMYSLDTDESNIQTMTHGDRTFIIWNDRMPTYYTSFNDETLIFDAYDVSEESTLQSSNTQCFGEVYSEFTFSDTYIPDLDATQFSLLLNEVKSRASISIGEMPNQKNEQQARRHLINSQRTKRRIPTKYAQMNNLPNYGRK